MLSGWKELSIIDWLKFICNDPSPSPAYDIEKSPEFAATVLSITSKNWDSITPGDRETIVALLAAKKCMPTAKRGLMKPGDTYFYNVKVLPDLPLIESIRGVKEKFLEQLGVRRVVALQLIFDCLGEGGDWSHIDGIKYLASVQKYANWLENSDNSNLTPDEMQKLREYPLCPSQADKKRKVVSQLYEPMREIEGLGLPIISWPKEVSSYVSTCLTTELEGRFCRGPLSLRPRLKSISSSTGVDKHRFKSFFGSRSP
jgi:Protein of unknown function (DUF3684)